MNAEAMELKIRAVLAQHARMSKDPQTLDASADLYDAGMTSHASVNVMLALEDAFGVEFPDELLKRSVFTSIASMGQALHEIMSPKASA